MDLRGPTISEIGSKCMFIATGNDHGLSIWKASGFSMKPETVQPFAQGLGCSQRYGGHCGHSASRRSEVQAMLRSTCHRQRLRIMWDALAMEAVSDGRKPIGLFPIAYLGLALRMIKSC